MALTTFGGPGLWTINDNRITLGPPAFTSSVIDATGEKMAWMGRAIFPDGAGGDIQRVGFLFGTVTKAGGSGLTVSLQNVDLANGPPARPDGTQDQTVAIANGDAGFASNLWYRTGALSADRTVSFGEQLAVVVEYDGSGRLSSDAVNFRNLSAMESVPFYESSCSLFASSAWGNVQVRPNVVLERDDGVFGTLDGSWPCSAVGTISYGTGTNPDENALQFTPAVNCTINGAYILMFTASSAANFDVVLYEGTTALQTVSCDANAMAFSAVALRSMFVAIPPTDLTASTTYRLCLKPTTAGAVDLAYFDVSANGHLDCHGLGATAWLNSRNDGGSWGAGTNTRRPWMGLRFSKFESGGGSGGGAHIIGG